MKKPRKSYMSYYKCDACGYPVSLPAKWAEIGHPRCLNPNCAKKTQPLTLQKPRLKFPEDDLPGTDEGQAPVKRSLQYCGSVKGSMAFPGPPENLPRDLLVTRAAVDAMPVQGYKANRLRILIELNGHTPEEAQRIFEQEQQEENES